MVKKSSLVLVCSVLELLFRSDAQAFPTYLPPDRPAVAAVTPVSGYCGINFHRSREGYCVANDQFEIYPPPQPPTQVVAPLGCPYGFYLGPDGRCFAPVACTSGYYLGPYGQCFPYWWQRRPWDW
jgi:hypothetical protein